MYRSIYYAVDNLPHDKKIDTRNKTHPAYIYRVSQTTRISRISQKLSAANKNTSDKSCTVLSNALHGDISMTLKSVFKVT